MVRMRRLAGMWALQCAVVVGLLGYAVSTQGQATPPEGFTALFNGKDLSGWWAPSGNLETSGFHVKNGVIAVDGSNRTVRALYTEKVYENFILELDYKISKGGNSGVFLHAPLSGRQSRVGFEVQILDDYGREPGTHSTGSIYDVVAPRANASKPAGQWNHYRIELNWPTLRVWLNGIQVQDVDLASHPALRFRFRDGYIALQNHGSDVEFRNIFIKELPSRLKWDTLFVASSLAGWRSVGEAKWTVKNGVLRGRGAHGYLVSEREFDAFELQGYFHRTDEPAGRIRYRWRSEKQPGYIAEMQCTELERENLLRHRGDGPWWMLPRLWGLWTPFQLICYRQYAELRLDGVVVARILNHQDVEPGKLAFECLGAAEPFELKGLRMRALAEEEIK